MKSIISILLFLIVWHLMTVFSVIDPGFYPSPFKITLNLIQLLKSDSDFTLNVILSLKRLLWASLLTFPVAIMLALLTSTNRLFDHLINPFVALTFPLPKVAIYPLMLLVFGIDEKSKIALIAVGIFYPVFINSRLGFRKVLNGPTADILKIYPLKTFDYCWHYLLKGSQLEILTGLKLALNYGLTLVVVSETTASNNGLGYFIWRSWDQFKLINVYSSIFLLSALGAIFYYGLDYLIQKNRQKYF